MRKILPILASAASAIIILSSCSAKDSLMESCHLYTDIGGIYETIDCREVLIGTCSELEVSGTKTVVVESCSDINLKENCHLYSEVQDKKITIECRENIPGGTCSKLAVGVTKTETVESCSDYP